MATRTRKTVKAKPEAAIEANPVEAKPVAAKPAETSGTVTVKYKSMHSIQFELNGKPVKINGANEDLRGKSTGVLTMGFGTTVLPRQQWEAIEAKYKSMSIFKNGLIFAYEQAASAEARAKEQEQDAELKTGFEPVEAKETK